MLDRLDASFGGRSRSVPGTRSAWPSGATSGRSRQPEPADPGDGTTEETAVIDVKRGGLLGGPPLPSGSRHDHAASGVVRRTERRGDLWGRLSPKL